MKLKDFAKFTQKHAPYLAEGTAEEMRGFYKNIPDNIYKEITEADPYTFMKGGVKQVGKKTKALLHVLNKSTDLADSFPGAEAVFAVIAPDIILPKALDSYASLSELMGDTKVSGEKARLAKLDKENPIIFPGDKFNVRKINNKEAAVYFGCGDNSGWCTAHPGGSYYDSTYNKDRGQIWIIARGAPDLENPNPKNLHSQLYITHEGNSEWKWSTAYAVSIGILNSKEPPVDRNNDGLDEPTHAFIHKILKKAEGQAYEFQGRTFKYKIDPDGTVVFGSIDLSDMGLTSLKEFTDGMSTLTAVVESVKKAYSTFKSYLKLA
jgi:hypothetical protein